MFLTPLLPVIFLIGSSALTYGAASLLYLGKFRSKEFTNAFIFPKLSEKIFPKKDWESLHFVLSTAKFIYQIAYLISALLFIDVAFDPELFFEVGALSILTLFLLNYLAQLSAATKSAKLVQLVGPITSIYLIFLFPLIYPLKKLRQKIEAFFSKYQQKDLPTKERLREIIHESELHLHLESPDQKFISSFIHFKERVAKEVMVPRVDLFALSSATTIREASPLFSEEGYSRIPIYKETLDQIIGVVLYKDLLNCLTNPEQNLDDPLETLFKPVLYTPENKKISQLLQEFRTKQIHMAIVVDEYGGTEGIVTIEDILEELVGEIEDEYDIDEEHPFWEIPGGGWIIDAKMTLLDIADQIGVHLPQSPSYDTLGGYVYHCAGTIPSKGWRISHDKFDLEVVFSSERAIKKIKVQPRTSS